MFSKLIVALPILIVVPPVVKSDPVALSVLSLASPLGPLLAALLPPTGVEMTSSITVYDLLK
jgi:hypothetical protein